MQSDQREFLNSLSERVLGAVFEVSNTLVAGFLEKVYERAPLGELRLPRPPGQILNPATSALTARKRA